MENVEQAIQTTDNEFVEKRFYKRFDLVDNVFLIIEDKEHKRKIVKFKSINICQQGILLQSNGYVFSTNQKVELILIYTLKENVSKIYYLTAIVRHSKNGRTGFLMHIRWPIED